MLLDVNGARADSTVCGLCFPMLSQTEILTRLRQFSAQNKLKKKALNIASAHLSQPELNGLRNIFRAYDANNDGFISVHELKESLVKAKQEGGNADAYKKVVAEIQALMSEVDEDGSGGIDYNEFLASTINSTWLERVDLLQKTFMELDTNKNGLLSKDEIAQVLDVSHEEVRWTHTFPLQILALVYLRVSLGIAVCRRRR